MSCMGAEIDCPSSFDYRIALVGEPTSEELSSIRQSYLSLGCQVESFNSAAGFHELRKSVFTGEVGLLHLCTLDPNDVLSFADLTVGVVWDLSQFGSERIKAELSRYSGSNSPAARALGRAGSVLAPNDEAADWIEDSFQIGVLVGRNPEELLAFDEQRMLIAVGAGMGNVLQATPLIKRVAREIGAPVDVLINSPIPDCSVLLSKTPWVNMVYSDPLVIEAKPYNKAFMSYNYGPVLHPLNCSHVVSQVRLFGMMNERYRCHETEFHFNGIGLMLPDMQVKGDELRDCFISEPPNVEKAENTVIGVFNGTKDNHWDCRSWKRFSELVQRLKEKGYTVRCFGMPHEMIDGAEDYTGTPLRKTVENIAECAFFISTDGGLFHIAEVLGIPTVVLFGPTSIVKNGPLNDAVRIVRSEEETAPYQWRIDFEMHNDTCMDDLSVESVLEAFATLSDRESVEDLEAALLKYSVSQAAAHELRYWDLPYRRKNEDAFRAESLKYLPTDVKSLMTIIQGNAEMGMRDRARQVYEYAADLHPEHKKLEAVWGGVQREWSTADILLRQQRIMQGEEQLRPEDVKLVDIYMTTANRPQFFEPCFLALLEAVKHSPYAHRLVVMVDSSDQATRSILEPYLGHIHLVSSPEQLGLPFMYNLLVDHAEALSTRSELVPDYICYIQDDCLICDPENYFRIMVETHLSTLEQKETGYVSGFYTAIHPGFEKRDAEFGSVLLTDSIDGKNFMGFPALLKMIGKLSWYFPDGDRRGNPGPARGSHFDLWQWKEAPYCTSELGRVNLVIPGLCKTIAQTGEDSTWGNKGEMDEVIQQRVQEGRIYNTRKDYPVLKERDYYRKPD